jgi:Mlc titration factor MtfA (ptsG expression regulator)
MATLAEMSERLLKRFKGVPNITLEDTTDWTEDALLSHGYSVADNVSSENTNLLLLYAQSQGAHQIAISSAHFFSYTDGEEQVDKSMISEQYRKLAADLRNQYEQTKSSSGSNFKVMRRIDRP